MSNIIIDDDVDPNIYLHKDSFCDHYTRPLTQQLHLIHVDHWIVYKINDRLKGKLIKCTPIDYMDNLIG